MSRWHSASNRSRSIILITENSGYRPQLLREITPVANRTHVRRFADLLRAGGGRTRRVLKILETGVIPGQANVLQHGAQGFFRSTDQVLVADFEETLAETFSPGCHQVAVTNVVACQFLEVIGIQVGVGEQLLVDCQAGVQRVAADMNNARVW